MGLRRGRVLLWALAPTAVAAWLIPVGLATTSPAGAGVTCTASPADPPATPAPVPIALVAGPNAEDLSSYAELGGASGAIKIVGRFTLGEKRTEGWEPTKIDKAESRLNGLVDEQRPLVIVVPIGLPKDDLQTLAQNTAQGVGVIDQVDLPPNEIADSAANRYAAKAQEVATELGKKQPSLTLSGGSGTWRLGVGDGFLPSETATANVIRVSVPDNGSGPTTGSTVPDQIPGGGGGPGGEPAVGVTAEVTCTPMSTALPLALPVTLKLEGLGQGTSPTVSADVVASVQSTTGRLFSALQATATGGSNERTATTEAKTTEPPATEVDPPRGEQAAPVVPSGSSGGGITDSMPFIFLALVAGVVGTWLVMRGRTTAAYAPGPASPGAGWPNAIPTPSPAMHPMTVAPAEHRPPAPPLPGWAAVVPNGADVRLGDIGLTRVGPRDLEEGRTWTCELRGSVGIAGWLEQKPGKGEDAEPTLRAHASGTGLLGVYDGLGGSGSVVARTLRDGTQLTGAYVASRLAREVTESWFTDVVDRSAPPTGTALHECLASAFGDEMLGLPAGPPGGVRGSLQRTLPTTLAAVGYRQEGRSVQARALWAGDSRCYALTPGAGLQVLTVDDTRETDALALIRNDQPMTNLVSADRPFAIGDEVQVFDGPVVLLTATDGCFGYVRTPAHFEYLVLHALVSAGSAEEWAASLLRFVSAVTADDASFSAVALNVADFDQLRALFAPRQDFLQEKHWLPFHADGADAEALSETSWSAYRDLYHARALEGGGDATG